MPTAAPQSRASAIRVWLGLAGILAIGLLLRVGYLTEFRTHPDFTVPQVDADFHDYWARGLAFSDWTLRGFHPDPEIRATPYFRPPGYPYFLAALYRMTGPSYLGPRLLQSILGLLNAVLVFALARRLFGAGAALAAAAMVATSWILLYFDFEFQEPTLFITLVLLFAHAAARWTEGRSDRDPRWPLAMGLLLGFAALVRPNSLLLVPPFALWMLWVARRREAPWPWRGLVLLLLGAGLAILPATIRNWRVAHDFVPISSNAGINLYIGNNPAAGGLVKGGTDVGNFDDCYDWPDIVRGVEQKLGRELRHSEVSDYFQSEALAYMGSHPAEVAALTWRKVLLFFGPLEPQDNKEVNEERRHSRVLSLGLFGFPLALALGLAGMFVVWMERNESPRAFELSLLLAILILGWFLSYLPFAITSRYRVPILPLLLLFAGHLLVRVVVWWRAGRRDLVWRPIALAALLAIPAHVNFAGYEPSVARWHYQRGLAQAVLKRNDLAIEEFQAALRANPKYAAVYNDLGTALASSGRIPEALPYFEQGVRGSPGNAIGWCNLGAALEHLGRNAEAGQAYGKALELRPRYARAREGSQRVAARAGGIGSP